MSELFKALIRICNYLTRHRYLYKEVFMKLIAALLAILFPPLGVLLVGASATTFVINLILTLLFYIPGLLHAWFVILSDD